MTTPAAVAAGVLILFTPLMQTITLLLNGSMMNRNMMMGMPMQVQSLITTGETSSILLTAIVVWLSPVRMNPWSLDGLMIRNRRRSLAGRVANATSKPASSAWTGRAGVSSLQGDPAASFPVELVNEFKPDATPTPEGPA
jgi:hypothetical protein